jgi:CBS domain containing-hemolysin-like protein
VHQVIGNNVVNSALSIVTSSLVGRLFGPFTSTIIVLYVGVIIPQFIRLHYGFIVGSHAVPVVKVVLTAILSYPTSKVLDYFLSDDAV